MLWGALTSKQLALMWLEHSLQYLATLSGFRIRDANSGNAKTLLGIPFRKFVAHSQCRLGDETESSPLEVRSQLENLSHGA